MAWKDQKTNMFDTLPAGNYPLALETYELKTTKPEKGSKLMYEAHLKVLECDVPELQPYVGRTLRDWFVVGVDADPGAEEPETLNSGTNMGCAKIKRMAEAAEVEPDDPSADITVEMLDDILNAVTGTEIVGHLTKKGPKGSENNNINGYFKVGERQLGLDSANTKSGTAKPQQQQAGAPAPTIHDMKKAAAAKAAAATKKAAPAPVSYDDDDEEEVVKPAPKQLKKVAKPVVVDDDDEEAALPPPAPKKGKAKTKAIACPLECGAKVEYENLAAHVEKCTGPAQEEVEEDDE